MQMQIEDKFFVSVCYHDINQNSLPKLHLKIWTQVIRDQKLETKMFHVISNVILIQCSTCFCLSEYFELMEFML